MYEFSIYKDKKDLKSIFNYFENIILSLEQKFITLNNPIDYYLLNLSENLRDKLKEELKKRELKIEKNYSKSSYLIKLEEIEYNVFFIKKYLIIIAKIYFNEFKNEWDKEKAIIFGKLLKKIKLQTIFRKKWIYKILNQKPCGLFYNIKRKNNKMILEKLSEKYIYLLDKEEDKIKSKFEISNVTNLYFSNNVTFIIVDGLILCKGSNTFGQLGVGDNNNYKDFINFSDYNKTISDNIIKICLGYAYTYFITSKGVYSVGAGENGRLGLGSTKDYNIPQKLNCFIDSTSNTFEEKMVIDIACGSTYVCFLTNNYEVYSCGAKYYNGQSNKDILIPTKINLDNIISIDIGCGGYHTCCLKLDGTIYLWGHNRVGQIGMSINDISKYYPNSIVQNNTRDEKNVIIIRPIKIKLKKSIIKISVGWGHTLILTLDNELYVCGRNSENQLGINFNNDDDNYFNFKIHEDETLYIDKFIKLSFDEKVIDIVTNQNHSLVRTETKLYVLGTKNYCERVYFDNLDIDNIILSKRDFSRLNSGDYASSGLCEYGGRL